MTVLIMRFDFARFINKVINKNMSVKTHTKNETHTGIERKYRIQTLKKKEKILKELRYNCITYKLDAVFPPARNLQMGGNKRLWFVLPLVRYGMLSSQQIWSNQRIWRCNLCFRIPKWAATGGNLVLLHPVREKRGGSIIFNVTQICYAPVGLWIVYAPAWSVSKLCTINSFFLLCCFRCVEFASKQHSQHSHIRRFQTSAQDPPFSSSFSQLISCSDIVSLIFMLGAPNSF